MDIRDAEILARLTANARQPLREIADALQITVAAVHKRILVLEEAGILRRYWCLVHPSLLDTTAYEISGRCPKPVTSAICDELGDDPGVFQVAATSDNRILISFIGDRRLPELLERARCLVGLADPEIHAYDFGPRPKVTLTGLDYAVAHGLGNHARRPLSQLVASIGASNGAISQRIRHLTRARALFYAIDLGTLGSNGLWTLVDLTTSERSAPGAVLGRALPPDRGSRLVWTSYYATSAARIRAWLWSASAEDLQYLQDTLAAHPAVASVTTGVLLAKRSYDTWVIEELRRRALATS